MDSQVVWLVVVGIAALLIVVIVSASKKKSPAGKANRAYETPGEEYRRLHGSFRGELGSPGTSSRVVGKHSVNCECNICLHGEKPDTRT